MNKKAFTLTELLSTILIIAFIFGIAVFAYTRVVNRSKDKAFEVYEETMYSETMSLLIESLTDPNKASLYPLNGETKRFSLTELGIKKINNPNNVNDLCLDSYVEVTRNDYQGTSSNDYMENLQYKVCLICRQSNYNVNGENCTIFPKD
jgi:prepilin-type N-terminal cleavage/methylation domain-containing protein